MVLYDPPYKRCGLDIEIGVCIDRSVMGAGESRLQEPTVLDNRGLPRILCHYLLMDSLRLFDRDRLKWFVLQRLAIFLSCLAIASRAGR